MIDRDEALVLLGMLASATRQPTDEMMEEVWVQLLAPLAPHHALEVVEMYVQDGQWFPKTSEFLASVHELQRRDELHSIQTDRTQAAFRCDGSRWRDSTVDPGRLEPCPTCNRAAYDMLKTDNAAWRNGKKHPGNALPSPPACTPMHEQPAPRGPKEALARLGATDWMNTRRDVM